MKRGKSIDDNDGYEWYINGKKACIRYQDFTGKDKEVCEIYEVNER